MENNTTEQRIIDAFGEYFTCIDGERRAWFEIPQRIGDPIRGTYVVYAFQGRDLNALETYFIEIVVHPLIIKAGGGGFLYWRHPERVQAYVGKTPTGSTNVIRTRIVVFNAALKEVRLNDVVKGEGGPIRSPLLGDRGRFVLPSARDTF